METLELFALIIALLTLVKILVVLNNPMIWLNNVAKPVYKNPRTLMAAGLIFGATSLYYLLQEISIIQIFAVMFFVVSIFLIGVAPFSKEISKFAETLYKQKNILRRARVSMIIWIILTLWVISEILF